MIPRNRHPRIPKSVVTKALKEYDAGDKAEVLAQRYGVHRATIFYWAKHRKPYVLPGSSNEMVNLFLYGSIK